MVQLVPILQAPTGRHPGKPITDQPRVDEFSGVEEHIGKASPVVVASGAVTFEANPSAQHERLQPVTRFQCERRRSLKAAAHLRRVDAEQAHAADARDIDRVTVNDARHECHNAAVFARGTRLRLHACRNAHHEQKHKR